MAYDPVQSLMALSTEKGEIHVFGGQQVEVVFSVGDAVVKEMRFVKGVYLVTLSEKSTISVYSLYSRQLLSSFSPPGSVTAFATDPTLDWVLLGLQNGSIYAYDIDRGNLTGFKLDNLQKRVLPKEKLSPVVSIQWNPREIGTLLIAYNKSALVYSFATDEIKVSMVYEVPPMAPGGEGRVTKEARHPAIVQALYHPNSLSIVTAHDDGSLVFWDALTGVLLLARTLFSVYVNSTVDFEMAPDGPLNSKFIKLQWVTHGHPDDTSLIIAGGDAPEGHGAHNLTVLDFGQALRYSMTTYERMGGYYSSPKQHRLLPLQNPSSLVDFLPLATRTPFFDGGHDPQFLLILTESGEVENLAFPSGASSYKSTLFPQSLAWIHPRTTISQTFVVPKKQWLGMVARPSKQDNILQGGEPTKKSLKPNAMRCALATGHSNGSVRLFDASHNELDDSSVLEVNVAYALNTITDVAVGKMSFAGATGELAVATIGGDVVMYKFSVNKLYNPKMTTLEEKMNRLSIQRERKLLIDLKDRTPNIREGFLPICALHGQRGPVSAINHSGVGFVVVAYDNGDVIVLDLRGPAVIYEDNIRRKSTLSTKVTSLEFSIMVFGDDSYSSILIFAGTDKGEIITYRLIPESSGRFSAQLVDLVQTNNDAITAIVPYRQESGTPAIATADLFHQLSEGMVLQGSVLSISVSDIRILVPGKARSSHKVYNKPVLTAGLSIVATKGSAKPYASCVPVVTSNSVKVLSLPELKEISSLSLPFGLNTWANHSSVLPSGDIIIRLSESRSAMVYICGTGQPLQQTQDRLYTPRRIPHRPQIGTAQWLKGTTLMGYEDLDTLIGGRRSGAKTKESELANGDVTVNNNTEDEFAYSKPVRGRQFGGYDPSRAIWRSVQDSYDSVEESINEYANQASASMNESIGDVKKDLVKGLIRSKFGI